MCVCTCVYCVCVCVWWNECILMSLCLCPHGAGFSRRGCLNQAAPPFSLFSYISFLSPSPFNYISFKSCLHNTSIFSSLLIAYFYLTGHSPVFIYNTALLYMILLTLCGHLQTQRVCCALHPVLGEDGVLVAEVPMGSNMLLRPRLPLDGWLGWPDPINRLVVLCPNFD